MRLLALHGFLVRASAAVAGGLLTLAAVFVCAGVISRYLFANPLGWPAEVSGYILLYATFLSAPWILSRDGHVSIDIVSELASARATALVGVVTSVTGAVVFAVLAYWGVRATWQAYSFGHPMPTVMATPRYVLLAVIPFGSTMLAIEFVLRALRFRDALNKRQAD